MGLVGHAAKTGTHQLYVKVSAALKDSRGVTTTTKLPDKEFKVSVTVHTGKATIAIVKRTVPALVLAGTRRVGCRALARRLMAKALCNFQSAGMALLSVCHLGRVHRPRPLN